MRSANRLFNGLIWIVLFSAPCLALAISVDCETIFSDVRQGDRIFSDARFLSTSVQIEDGISISDLARRPETDDANRVRMRKAAHVRQALEKKVARGSQIRSLLYLASAYDASTPFLIFKNLETVVGVDGHAFISDGVSSFQPKKPIDDYHAFTYVVDADFETVMAPPIIARLKMEIPDFRLRSVMSYAEVVENRTFRHGLVQFDSGPGSRLRQYIHVQAAIESAGLTPVLETLNREVFDAILVKGSMAVYRVTTSKGLDHDDVASRLVKKLVNQGGLIVDGDGTRWPWLQADGSIKNKFSRIRLHKTHVEDFGYADVKIYEIDEPLPPRSRGREVLKSTN